MQVTMARAASKVSSLLLLLLLLGSCDDKVYHKFYCVPDSWNNRDTLTFTISYPYTDLQLCDAYVELRHTHRYPCKRLWLRTQIHHTAYDSVTTDTICCEIFDSLGRQKGASAGLLYQTSHKLAPIELSSKDTVTISLTHIMNDCIEGLCDVGIRVERCGRHQLSGN